MDYLRVSIPDDLMLYKIADLYKNAGTDFSLPDEEECFVKIYKNDNEKIEYIAYFSDDNELLKKVFYDGFNIKRKDNYRNNCLRISETFENGNMISRVKFDKFGNIKSEVSYEYNKKNNITSITKSCNEHIYKITYGYDELARINFRKIFIDGTCVQEQKFRFDILDRIVEYKDNNQRLIVEKFDSDCGLISYKIIDKIGNEIYINNDFIDKKYKNTTITLNGHNSVVMDAEYTDNVMLKKPYTTEDDLDLVIANLLRPSNVLTKRKNNSDIAQNIINENIEVRVLPISIRKRVLYNIAVNG